MNLTSWECIVCAMYMVYVIYIVYQDLLTFPNLLILIRKLELFQKYIILKLKNTEKPIWTWVRRKIG